MPHFFKGFSTSRRVATVFFRVLVELYYIVMNVHYLLNIRTLLSEAMLIESDYGSCVKVEPDQVEAFEDFAKSVKEGD